VLPDLRFNTSTAQNYGAGSARMKGGSSARRPIAECWRLVDRHAVQRHGEHRVARSAQLSEDAGERGVARGQTVASVPRTSSTPCSNRATAYSRRTSPHRSTGETDSGVRQRGIAADLRPLSAAGHRCRSAGAGRERPARARLKVDIMRAERGSHAATTRSHRRRSTRRPQAPTLSRSTSTAC
jgi:hypothetical protein